MVFSSIVFLCYFLPALLVVYRLTPDRFKNALLLAASVFFYAWGAPRFVFVILGTTIVDFFLVMRMDRMADSVRRKLLLTLSVLLNVGLLVYFKYMNFFIDNVNAVLHVAGFDSAIPWAKLALPIGISFYTFETLTYVVDVYRRIHKPLRNFWDYQLYIILFPKLIAGPIIRYHELADQIHGRFQTEKAEDRLLGLYRFCLGLAKKVILANTLGEYADSVYGDAFDGSGALDASTLAASTAWLAALTYTFQIYFDFSGYSDMAIGLGRMFGFRFPENFTNPYTSGSITEFWRRWHMTLGNWMRNYLYIPLGGNQVSPWRLYFNLVVVFLLSGLWHGATWSFIFWGAYHGLFLVLERLFLLKWLGKLPKLVQVAFTFVVVLFGWVFFRVEKLSDAFEYIGAMFHTEGHWQMPAAEVVWMTIIAAVFAVFVLLPGGKRVQDVVFGEKSLSSATHVGFLFAAFIIYFYVVGAISASTFNPFIYFRF
jgi:alginate O-acetyltransferase complex protein AlgI